MTAFKVPPGVDPRVSLQYQQSNTSMQDKGHAGRSILEKQATGERRVDY